LIIGNCKTLKIINRFGVVDLKLRRNLCVIVTGIVACSLFAGGFAEWKNSGIGVGSHFRGITQTWAPAVLVCYVVGAVGVILLGWHWLKLAKTVTSIARLLEKDKVARIGAKKKFFAAFRMTKINELSKAISEQLDNYSDCIAGLEKQIKGLQVQIQLSQRQKRNTEAIIHGIRDAVIVIDEFDKLLMANEAAGKLFDFDFKSSQHKSVSELVCSEKTGAGENEFVDFLHRSRLTKVRHTKREFEFSEDGRPKTFDCTVSCVYNHTERVCGVVAVLHNVTREKEISQMKNDFVNHVSHELKTPLASISAYSEMLADGEAEDEQTRKEFYSVIQSQAKRLNRLIEDILNTSRIESGLIKVRKNPVSLTILIEDQLQMIKSAANEKHIKIIRRKPIVFDRVYADKDMISQVIVNLLGNAVKYTRPGGSIKIETEVDEIAGLARVSVADTGVGIPESELEHIFDKFYRVGANKSQAKGTGLGLNLVKQIVEKVHNGRVFVTSQVGVGSTFGFELPLATSEVVESVQ